jgi:hypothetical protein
MSSSFLDRFDVHRPALTLVIYNPASASLMTGVNTRQRRRAYPSNTMTTSQSSLGKETPHHLEDDESFITDIQLSKSSSATSRGFFHRIGASGSSWSNMIRDFNPAFHFAMQTSEKKSDNDKDDVRPFPETMPWITGALCEATWSPFPIYSDIDDHSHELLCVPHFLRLCARVKLPQIKSINSLWQRLPMISNSSVNINVGTTKILGQDGDVSKYTKTTNVEDGAMNELDLGITYRNSNHSALEHGRRTLDFVIEGCKSPLLSSAKPSRNKLMKRFPRTDSNHLLLRLGGKRHTETVEYIRGSFRFPNPMKFLKDSSEITVMPSYDFAEGEARCILSSDMSRRTRATLKLDADDTTLTIERAFDGGKIIAPTISLNSGEIMYDYYLNLVNSSIQGTVDPMRGIIVKWTDGDSVGGSCWVTECRVPLGMSSHEKLAADIKVGRRWAI